MKVSFWTLLDISNLSQQLRGTLATAFERQLTIEDFTDMDQHTGKLTACSYHVTCVFQRESTLYISLNVKELLARSRRKIWSLSDCNWTRTQDHLVCKWTLNHLAKLAKWLSCVLSTYLYCALDCMFLSCHVRVSEWIYTL